MKRQVIFDIDSHGDYVGTTICPFCSKLIECFSNESGTFIICEHLQRLEREVGEGIELYAIFEKKTNLEIRDVTGFGDIVKSEALI